MDDLTMKFYWLSLNDKVSKLEVLVQIPSKKTVHGQNLTMEFDWMIYLLVLL
jgi:hypothetical protein